MAASTELFVIPGILKEATQVGTQIFTGYATTAWLNGLKRAELLQSNVDSPNVVPGVSELVDCYNKGGCDYQQLEVSLAYTGVGVGRYNQGMLYGRMWEKIFDCQRPRLPIDMLLRADALGKDLQEPVDMSVKRLGYRFTKDRNILATDTLPLQLGFILELFDRGIIGDDDLRKLLLHAGYRDDLINLLVQQSSDGIDPSSAITLLNRGAISSDDYATYQKWAGIRDSKASEQQKELRWTWPSLSQVILYGQLGAFDDDRASTLRLDDEQPDNFEAFARANGAHWGPGDTPPKNWPSSSQTPADLAWRAHWRPNDIGTAITMLHRLRSDPNNPGQSRQPGVPAYTADDFQQDLAANAIPPGRRQQLQAVSYTLPRATVFKSALQAGTIDKNTLVQQLQDVGYTAAVSNTLADTWEHQNTQRQVNALRPISLSQVKEAYRLGTISRSQAALDLYLIYLDDYSQMIRFAALPADAQAGEAASNAFVQIALTSIDADIAGELAKQAIEVIRKAYLRLEIDASQALSQLSGLGIVPQRASQYLQLWTAEHAASGLESTASQLRDWYINHLIDLPTYTTRLTLLGYGTGDVQLMVARANLDISKKAAQLQAQTVKAQGMAAKQLAAAAKANAAAQKQIQKQMCSSGTKSQVAAWTVSGLLPYPEGFKRLQDCGMTPDDAIRALVAKQPKKGGLDAKTVEEKAGFQSTLGGAIPTV